MHARQLLFSPLRKLPSFVKHKGFQAEEPLTFGESQALKMSQRTLILILGATAAAGIGYAKITYDSNKDHDTVVELVAQRASDHDLLVRVSTNLELLQRQIERDDRRAAHSTATVSHQ